MTKEKSLDEVKEKALEFRKSGDTYRSIGIYLTNSGLSEEDVAEAIIHVKQLETSKAFKLQPAGQKQISFFHAAIGILLIVGGIIITDVLWSKGWIASLPFVIIVAGLGMLGGSFKK